MSGGCSSPSIARSTGGSSRSPIGSTGVWSTAGIFQMMVGEIARTISSSSASCGLGGDAFAIVWDGRELHGLNASGVAPGAWSPAYFRCKYGEDDRGLANRPVRGWDTVTVPGVIAGWVELQKKFGKLPFADVLQPAVQVAERGYAV